MRDEQVKRVRSFSRVVTQRVGALQDSYASRGRPLAEARLLFEIGSSGGTADLRLLRSGLGLDSGYLSRLLRSLEEQGMVIVRQSKGDGRAREATLSAQGWREYETYNALSDRLAENILAPLGTEERQKLVSAMAQVEKYMRLASLQIDVEPPATPEARWCLEQYFLELSDRFGIPFDPANGNMLSDEEMTPPLGWLLVARLDGEAVGCGALKRLDETTGEVKRVWIASSARGLGIASRLMDRLETLAREKDFSAVKLDTNKTLTEARALYLKRGYSEIARYNDNAYADFWFEKRL